jgi:hypothetical protein
MILQAGVMPSQEVPSAMADYQQHLATADEFCLMRTKTGRFFGQFRKVA